MISITVSALVTEPFQERYPTPSKTIVVFALALGPMAASILFLGLLSERKPNGSCRR